MTELRPRTCPDCGYETDSSSHPLNEEARPGEGDIALCMNCGAISLYLADLSQRAITDEEYRGLPPQVIEQLTNIEQARRKMIGGIIGDLKR